MKHPDKDKLIAAAATSAVLILLLLGLMFGRFAVDLTQDQKWPPVDSSEIVFGGEFVKMGDLPTPAEDNDAEMLPQSSAEEATHDGTDMDNQGEAVPEDPNKVTLDQESPAKEEKKPELEKAGPTKEELAELERIKREKAQADQRKKIGNRLRTGSTKAQPKQKASQVRPTATPTRA